MYTALSQNSSWLEYTTKVKKIILIYKLNTILLLFYYIINFIILLLMIGMW